MIGIEPKKLRCIRAHFENVLDFLASPVVKAAYRGKADELCRLTKEAIGWCNETMGDN